MNIDRTEVDAILCSHHNPETTTIDSHSPIWNIRDCDTLALNQHTLDLERQGLRHSVDDWAPVCRNLLLLG